MGIYCLLEKFRKIRRIAAAALIGCLLAGCGIQAVPGAEVQNDDSAVNDETDSAANEAPLYDIPDIGTIDIYAVNKTPAEKIPDTDWDASLFYWLEDVSRENLEDGYLAKCRISKALLRNAENGMLIQYEVYRDPQTDEIYKIVSIEEEGGQLRLTDYYYRNGIPNFAFVRYDSVYTPTYATTDKTGERYYFANDMLVQWRIIRTPGAIDDYTISSERSSNRKHDYFKQDETAKKAYDDNELRMLNAAYNTYNAILSYTGIGVMEGVVQDTSGAGVGGATVEIRRNGDNVLLYRVATEQDGSFKCHVYLDGAECYITVKAGEAFKIAIVYGVALKDSGITGAYGTIILSKAGAEEYPVHINIYIADDAKSKGDGSLENTPAAGATAILREGAGMREGEALLTLQVGEGGSLDTVLPSGIYTAQIDAPGCIRTFLEICVEDRETNIDGYVLKSLPEGMTGVLLTWTGMGVDLDLTLFTPFQGEGGDMARIGSQTASDAYGNFLMSDNSYGCEVIYVNTAQDGSYKVYVNDYTNSQAGNYSADMLGKINIHIYIYDSTGLVAEYAFPAGQTGVVWEVAEISGSRITPSQRVYDRVEGKNWWLEKKQPSSNANETSNQNARLVGNWITVWREGREALYTKIYEFYEDGRFVDQPYVYSNAAYYPPEFDFGESGWFIAPKGHPSYGGTYTFDGENLFLQYASDEENEYYGMAGEQRTLSVGDILTDSIVLDGRKYVPIDDSQLATEVDIEELCGKLGVDCSVY